MIQKARIAYAGSILPLTLKKELPEGVGTRHRAAVGITEETDAVVVVISEETASISFVMSGEIVQNLTAPRLREVLSDVLSSDRRDLPRSLLATAEGPTAVREEGADPFFRSRSLIEGAHLGFHRAERRQIAVLDIIDADDVDSARRSDRVAHLFWGELEQRLRHRRAEETSSAEPTSTDPIGAPRPFDRQTDTVSNGAATSAGLTPRATAAFHNRAPSRW